jgi:hypothetical protein
MKIEKSLYVAIRKDTYSGREWMDYSSINGLIEEVQRKTGELDKAIPHWAKGNPVIRISEVKCIEGATILEPSIR